MPNGASNPNVSISFNKSNHGEVHWKAMPGKAQSPLSNTSATKVNWQERGGSGRQLDCLMELQLNKVRFQHEKYPETTSQASRQILLIQEVEIRDRLASSQINKFLYLYTSESMPRQSHANMVVIKAVHLRADPLLPRQECALKFSVLPLRLNIDQDALFFLCNFFGNLSSNEEMKCMDLGRRISAASFNGGSSKNGPNPFESIKNNCAKIVNTHSVPVMTVVTIPCADTPSSPLPRTSSLNSDSAKSLISFDDTTKMNLDTNDITCKSDVIESSPISTPIFFRSFLFSPDVPIRLDYQGKHVDMEQGALTGLLIGLGQLSCSELRLKRISYRQG